MASRGWIGLFKFHSICPVWFEYWFYVLLKHLPDIVRWVFYVLLKHLPDIVRWVFYVLLKHLPDIVRWVFYVTQYKQVLGGCFM